MTKTPQQGDTPGSWKVANSPGALLSRDQLPRNAGLVFDVGTETSHVVRSQTKLFVKKRFKLSILEALVL